MCLSQRTGERYTPVDAINDGASGKETPYVNSWLGLQKVSFNDRVGLLAKLSKSVITDNEAKPSMIKIKIHIKEDLQT